MMRLIFSLIVLLSLFTCCTSGPTVPDSKAIQERLLSGEFDAYNHLPNIPCDSLMIDSLEHYTLKDSLFTGVCYTNYPNQTEKLEIKQIFRGKLHGNRIMLSPKGDTLSMNLYNHGKLLRKSIGKNEVVHCDSLEIFKNDSGKELRFYYGEPYTGFCELYYPDDTTAIYIRAAYSKGLRNGDVIIFDKSGNEIVREFYQSGELMQR